MTGSAGPGDLNLSIVAQPQMCVSDSPIPPLEFWLTAHAELKTSARIRRVYDFLADALQQQYGPQEVRPDRTTQTRGAPQR